MKHGIDVVPEAPPPKKHTAQEFVEFFAPYFASLTSADRRLIANAILAADAIAAQGRS